MNNKLAKKIRRIAKQTASGSLSQKNLRKFYQSVKNDVKLNLKGKAKND